MTIEELKYFVTTYKKKNRKETVKFKEIINLVSNTTSIRQTTVSLVLKCAMSVIRDTLDNGKNVEIKDFGTFALRERMPRLTNDINRKGGLIFTPPKAFVKFFPDTTWKWTQFACNLRIPEDFKLPEGVNFGARIERMFANHDRFGFHRKDKDLTEQ